MFLGQVTSEEFLRSFGKLIGLEYFKSTPVMHRLVRLSKTLGEEQKKYHETRQKLLDRLGDKDEEGHLVVINHPNGTQEVSVKKLRREFDTEIDTLNQLEVPITDSFLLSELKQYDPRIKLEYDAPLSPKDMLVLGDIIKAE